MSAVRLIDAVPHNKIPFSFESYGGAKVTKPRLTNPQSEHSLPRFGVV